VEVPNPKGIHLRPTQMILETAGRFQSEITIQVRDKTISTKEAPFLKLLQELAAAEVYQGTKLRIQASGEDAEAAVDALVDLVKRGFDEMDEAPASTEPAT
jgi:phosphotransferase system HPr (HPr) family protein